MENKIQFSKSYETKYKHYTHSVGTLMFYLQGCTKYRYKMFRKEKNKRLLVAGIAGASGGALGAVSGSSSLFVVTVVSAVTAVLIAWGINGMFN